MKGGGGWECQGRSHCEDDIEVYHVFWAGGHFRDWLIQKLVYSDKEGQGSGSAAGQGR